MRGRDRSGWRSAGRVLLRTAGWCLVLSALLTCTPPDFTPPPPEPTGHPLTIAPLEPEVTAGMSFTFLASGGTPPYTYGVTGGGDITSTGTYTAPGYPTTVTVHVTDKADDTASTVVIVRASQLWVIPADVTIPAETSITFQGHGGTPPYTYSVIGGLGSFGTYPNENVYTSPATSTTATIRVRDSAPVSVSVTTSVVVLPPADPLTITPASAIIEKDVSITFSASGGTPSYVFGMESGVGSIASGTGVYSSDLSGSATVKVTDHGGSGTTVTASVTVNAPPDPLTITPTSATVIVGGTQTFTAAGGTSPYAFTLGSGDPGSLSGTGNSRVYHAVGAGTATLTVTDSKARTASAPITITNALGITPSSTSIEVLGTVMLVASGGSGTYTSWTVSSGGGSVPPGSSGPTVIYTAPGTPGPVTVTVQDNLLSTADCDITVTPGPLTISPATITLQVGNTVVFTADGGASYTFEVLSGVGSIGLTTGEYNAGSVEGTAIVRVTDNYSRTQDAAVTVNPPPLVLSPASITIQSGGSVTFTADGGTPPYAFTKVSGVGSINGTTGVYTSSAEGTATVKVTDDKGRTDTATVTVEPPPAPPLNLSPVSVNVQTGGTQTFSASGGATPYAWDVVQGAPGGTINQSGWYTAPAASGVYTVRLTDHDATVRTAEVNVFAPLAISPHPATVDAGTPVDFTATGGIPPYTFTLPTHLGSLATVDADTVRYTAPGTAGAETVRVTDSLDMPAEWTFNIVDPAKWGTKQPIDASKKSGQYASLAINPATAPLPGAPQIVYWEAQGKDLKLAKWNGSSWDLSAIDHNNGGDKYASLVLDADGHARVAWYDASAHDLKYRAWTGSGWISEMTVDSTGDVGQFASLALDSTDNPGIAYYDATNQDLKYAEWNGSTWTWTVPTVDTVGDVGRYASLAIDGSGNPRIAYSDASGALKYAAWNGSDWIVETVDTVGQFASLKLDGSDQPCIAYYDAGGKNLKYAAYHTGSWHLETVDSAGDVGQYASLALDPSNQHPHVAYYDATGGNLRYAAWNGVVWVIGTVDGSANNVGQYASLALDPTGLMRIAYYNATATVLDLLFVSEQP